MSHQNLLVISDDVLDAPKELFLAETTDHEVTVHFPNLSQDYYDSIYLKLDHRVEPAYLLRDKCKKHSKHWPRLFPGRDITMKWVCRKFFNAKLNNDAPSVSSPFDETEGQKVVKSVFDIILLDGHHCHNLEQMLQDESNHPWGDGHVHIDVIMRQDGATI